MIFDYLLAKDECPNCRRIKVRSMVVMGMMGFIVFVAGVRMAYDQWIITQLVKITQDAGVPMPPGKDNPLYWR
jgi:hypothetical protein